MIEYQLLILDEIEGPMMTRILTADNERDVAHRKLVAELSYASSIVYVYEHVGDGRMERRKDIERMTP